MMWSILLLSSFHKYDFISVPKIELPAISTTLSVSSMPIQPKPASPFSIPELGIYSNLVPSVLTGEQLSVPASEVGYYYTLYMGHTPGVFSNLARAKIGQKVIINNKNYTIESVGTYKVKPDRKTYEGFNLGMAEFIAMPAGKIVLMTCANGKDSHRIIVIARPII